MPFVNAAGVDVHYVEHGSSDAQAGHTAVILHGFSLDHRHAVATFEPSFLRRPSWRRIYLDFPGMGCTPAPDWVSSTDDVLRVTRAAVDALVPARYALAGCSYGGYIAMGLAAAAPDRVSGMALLVPMVVPIHAERDVPDHEVLVREEGITGSDLLEETGVVVTAETLRRTSEEIDAAAAIADEAAIERIAASYAGSFPLVPPSGRYERPALVVVGRQDSVTGFRDQWRSLGQWPRATFAVLDRAGHGLHIEQSALLDVLVSEWLERVEEGNLPS